MSASGSYSVPGATLTHTHSNGIRMLHAGQPHQQMQAQHTHLLNNHVPVQHQQTKVRTAAPISVTTSAHGKPVPGTQTHRGHPTVAMTVQQRPEAADVRIARSGIISQLNSLHASSPVSQTSTSSVRQGISLSTVLAKPGRGITLPTSKVAQLSYPSASMRKLLQPIPPRSSLAAAAPTNNSVYSSAGRASVNAQQASRRINSEPGNLSAVTTSSQIKEQGGKYKYTKVVGGKLVPRSASMTLSSDVSPQIFLDKLLQSRGYCTRNYSSLEGGYYCKPTPLQKASYGVRIVQAIRQSDEVALCKILKCGSSPNPCNAFGESVVHMVCRRGDYKMLKIFKDAGCSLQVTDDFGRTPLHDACWTAEPNFETVDMILSTDERMLHIVDCRGSPPLSYVKRDHWAQWVAFFQARADTYWPPRDIAKDGEEPPPSLCNEAPHSRPIKDPPNAATMDVAQLIASGKMTPDDYLAGGGAPSQVKTASAPAVTTAAVSIAT